MSQENVENARRSYATLNEAYRQGDASVFLPILEEMWAPDAVFEPAGVLPDSSPRPHRGWDGVLHFIDNQMEAFSEGWVEADEFIDRGDYLVVPYRFGGRARHTGLPIEFSFAHLITLREGKVTRCEVHKTVDGALQAAGFSEEAMSQENVEVVRSHLEAWNRRDRAAYVTSFRSDAEIDWSRARALYRGVYRGREQQKAFWDVFWSTFEDSQLEIHDLTEAGSEVVVWNTAHMWGRDGIEVTARSALVFTVENGEITCIRLFQERAEALETVGLSE